MQHTIKAFALGTIQRGKDEDGNKRIVPAGTVFDATETELMHLTPIGFVRRPTKEELAVEKWDQAEAALGIDTGAAAAVIREFAPEEERDSALSNLEQYSTEQRDAALRGEPTTTKPKTGRAAKAAATGEGSEDSKGSANDMGI